MPTIRTTFDPTREITVDDSEYAYLLRMGLIYTGEPVDPTPPPYSGPPLPPGAELPDDVGTTVNVYLTNAPTKLITVTIPEYYDLVAQGLVLRTESGPPISHPGFVPGVPETVLSHVYAESPHPAYDDMPSLRLIFENGIV